MDDPISSIPAEIVLQIVAHLHTPVTYRHYERAIRRRDFFDIFIPYRFDDVFRFNNVGQRVVRAVHLAEARQWRPIDDEVEPDNPNPVEPPPIREPDYVVSQYHIILEQRKYDPGSFNVTTAKNLRLVCSSFANTYSTAYIHEHIGGSFMVKALSDVMRFNVRLSREYLRPYAACVTLDRIGLFIPIQVPSLHGNLMNVSVFHRRNLRTIHARVPDDVKAWLRKVPERIFNNALCSTKMLPFINHQLDTIFKNNHVRCGYNRNVSNTTPNTGLYEDHINLDWASLYPSLMNPLPPYPSTVGSLNNDYDGPTPHIHHGTIQVNIPQQLQALGRARRAASHRMQMVNRGVGMTLSTTSCAPITTTAGNVIPLSSLSPKLMKVVNTMARNRVTYGTINPMNMTHEQLTYINIAMANGQLLVANGHLLVNDTMIIVNDNVICSGSKIMVGYQIVMNKVVKKTNRLVLNALAKVSNLRKKKDKHPHCKKRINSYNYKFIQVSKSNKQKRR
jgi:hypothetical protein